MYTKQNKTQFGKQGWKSFSALWKARKYFSLRQLHRSTILDILSASNLFAKTILLSDLIVKKMINENMYKTTEGSIW